jgi:hypothetical protein
MERSSSKNDWQGNKSSKMGRLRKGDPAKTTTMARSFHDNICDGQQLLRSMTKAVRLCKQSDIIVTVGAVVSLGKTLAVLPWKVVAKDVLK